MKIVVIGNDNSWNELTGNYKDIQWLATKNTPDAFKQDDVDAIFNLSENAHIEDYSATKKPVFIRSDRPDTRHY